MATINYENKEAISVNPTIPNKNKVVDSDMNLIKQVGNQILTTMGVYTDDWDEEGTYLIDDIVIYDNRIFKNLTGTNTTTPPTEDTTNWLEVSIRDISGGAEIPIQNTAPANPREDDLWIDTSEPEEMQEAIKNEYSTSTTDTYSCDYVNNTFGINNYSNVEDGYIKFPTGLMIQWGSENLSRTATNQQEISINFPQTFNAAFTVVASINDPGYGLGELNEGVGVLNINSSSFTCLFKSLTNTAHSVTIRWIAIGKWK